MGCQESVSAIYLSQDNPAGFIGPLRIQAAVL